MNNRGFYIRLLGFLSSLLIFYPAPSSASECFQASITSPTPFMGNNDEVFVLSDGSIWQIKYAYEYLYEYYPSVVICPSKNTLIIKGKRLSVVPMKVGRSSNADRAPSNALTVVYRVRGCDYFLADGPAGFYLLEWYGGYDPQKGDKLIGYERGYGFKTVTYLNNGRQGRIYADDYLLSSGSAAKKLNEKCN